MRSAPLASASTQRPNALNSRAQPVPSGAAVPTRKTIGSATAGRALPTTTVAAAKTATATRLRRTRPLERELRGAPDLDLHFRRRGADVVVVAQLHGVIARGQAEHRRADEARAPPVDPHLGHDVAVE